MAALAGTAASAAASRRILGAELDADAAEINSRSYGGLSEKVARALRTDWASPIAESLGAETSKLLTAWVDATKLGVPASGARAFAELATKTSSAWEVPFENVTDIFGTINTLLTSKGEAFSADRLKSVANTLQHLAAKQSTTPEKLISFLQRGAGAAQVLGMTQESGLAFGSASTSLGNQAGQSGRMFDYLASRVIEMPRLTKRDGEEGDQARALVKALGYGSAEQMDRQRRANPDEFLPDFMSRFSNIKQQKKQDEAIRFFTGREWLGEFGRMVKGADTYKEAVRLSKESKGLDAIGAVWDLHRLKLRFVFRQFRAGWLNILGEFGKVLSPMAREAGDYFLNWTSKLRAGGLQARFKASLDGLLEGLGFRNLPDMLNRVFGKPGDGAAGAIETWKATFREFGAGIRDVLDSFRSFANVFTGGSPEAIARWTGRILTLSAALLVLSPVLTVLGGITTGILALGSAAATVFTAMKVAGLVGASGAAAGAGAGAGGLAALLGAAVLPVSLVAISAGVIAALLGKEALKGAWLGVWSGKGATPNTPEGDLGAELGAIAPRGRRRDGDAKIEKQSLNGDFDRRLVQPASLVTHQLVAGLDRLGRALGTTGIGTQITGLSTSASAAIGGLGISGGAGGGAPGFSGGSVPRVPGWFGRGGSGGGGMPDPGTGAGAGPYKGLLDHIARSEGTANRPGGGYDTSLDYGRWTGGEKNLSGMTLDAIDRLQTGMLAHPENRARYGNGLGSSAVGRYQIVRKTLRGLRQRLGLGGGQLFDPAMQDRLGAELVRGRGANGTLGDEWASLRGGKLAEAIDLARQIPKGASTSPAGPLTPNGAASNPGPLVGGVHPLDGRSRLTSDFGMRRHPISGMLKPHRGIDLAAPGGTAVKAMRDGTVSIDRSGDVTVKHGDGTSTTYRHVNAGVEAGQKVAAGQQIATLRQHDPRSTGPHLHLEGRDANGKLIDPKTLLRPKEKAQAVAEEAMKPFESSGWKPQAPATEGVPADPGFTSTGWKPTSAADAIKKVPAPAPRPAQGMGQGGGAGSAGPAGSTSRGGATIHVTNNINASHQSPSEMAGHIQRHITEAWNYRAHDLEPELT